ncbi:CLUMA_CG014054, isoform A [Clunio marinus]|uniref:CLUMA_CG014054, isoform A n=1 Tax=Clunio marinus TaxID=568069 RepID=A0A1J1IQM5_9DIPT|nr:CLUMA_CG014054, isoform A [Clunio marinus]
MIRIQNFSVYFVTGKTLWKLPQHFHMSKTSKKNKDETYLTMVSSISNHVKPLAIKTIFIFSILKALRLVAKLEGKPQSLSSGHKSF